MNDLISRDALMDKVLKLDGVGGIYLYNPEEVQQLIETAPAVDAIPVSWLHEKLRGHPEIAYSITDGIIRVLTLWKEEKEEY